MNSTSKTILTLREIDEMPENTARDVVKVVVASSEFAAFVSSTDRGVFPVAVASIELRQALRTTAQVVRLSADDRDKQLRKSYQDGRHRYDLAQLMIDNGWIIQYRAGVVSLYEEDGAWFHAAIRVTKAGDELYLKSLRRADAGQLERDKARGIVVQEKSSRAAKEEGAD